MNITARKPRTEKRLIDGLLHMQPLFQENIPSINLVSKLMCYRIDCILLSFSKFGQRRLVIKNYPGALCQPVGRNNCVKDHERKFIF